VKVSPEAATVAVDRETHLRHAVKDRHRTFNVGSLDATVGETANGAMVLDV
jgi:hypothetical protein